MSILKLGTIYGEIMKIGDLAKATHTKVETIRYYEREGLLHEAVRTMGNYRVYNVEHLDRLSFIRHCRSLDMTLEEIKTLLRYKDFPPEDCSNVNALIDEHIEHVAVRIKELKHLQKQLIDLRKNCSGTGLVNQCGVLTELSKASRAEQGSNNLEFNHVNGTHKFSHK
jgi:Cd(II)/Pb(II)-responsive transcriptional regulator